MREKPRFALQDEDHSAKKPALRPTANQSKDPSTQANQTKQKKPAQQTFRTEVTITAIQKVTLTTEATSSSEAQKEFRALTEQLSIDPTQATITRKTGQLKKER